MEPVWFEMNDNGRKLLVFVSEGIGDQLTREDISNGYIDYINYETWVLSGNGLEDGDGGMIMFRAPLDKLFVSLEGTVPMVVNELTNKSTRAYEQKYEIIK